MTRLCRLLGVLLLWTAVLAMPASATTCGNGQVEDGEDCDDGNTHPGDCCSPRCKVEESYLGCAGECLCDTCDDGVDNDDDGLVDANDPECATLSDLQRVSLAARTGSLRPPPARDDDQLTCLASRALPMSAEDDGLCDQANDAASIAGIRIAELDGAPLAELISASGDDERLLSFDSGTSILTLDRLELAIGTRLRLIGSSDSTVVIQIAGDLILDADARVSVDGGLRADRVLWNLAGNRGVVRFGPRTSMAGTVLAPERDVRLECEADVAGGLYSREVESDADQKCRS